MEVFGQITHILDENSQIRFFNNLNTNMSVCLLELFLLVREMPHLLLSDKICNVKQGFLSSANEVSTGPTCQFVYVCLSFRMYVFPVFFSLSKQPRSFCLNYFWGSSGAARGQKTIFEGLRPTTFDGRQTLTEDSL